MVRSRLGRYKNSTKYKKNELKNLFFEVLLKSVFYCEKEILWRIELFDKFSSRSFFLPKKYYAELRYVRSVQAVVFSCQKYYALIYAMFEASKPIFFPAKKKTSIYVDIFSCQKTPDFRDFKRLYVTPRHSTSRVALTSAVFKPEKGSKTRKTKSAGNWMTYFRARF